MDGEAPPGGGHWGNSGGAPSFPVPASFNPSPEGRGAVEQGAGLGAGEGDHSPASPLPFLSLVPSLPGLMDDRLRQPGRLSDNLACGFLMQDNSLQPGDVALTTSVSSCRGG